MHDLLIFCEPRAHDIFVGPEFNSLPLQCDFFIGPGFDSQARLPVVGQCVLWPMSMFDKSMSGWRPKTSKRGGLPHISHEPRKPVPLGTMIRNAVECTTGIFVHHDLVDSSN